ncbi:efflux RND transporter periplasmic adaptor subunit [Desulfatiferula olefinivorans]
MKQRSIYGMIVGMILTLTAMGCTDNDTQETEVIRPVRYEVVTSSAGLRTRVFSGTAKSSLTSNLSFRVPGTVSRVAVKVGDTVQNGQIIAVLDPKDYMLQVQDAEAGLALATAQALNASSNYERVRKLYENDTVSKSDLDNSRAAFDSAQAQVRSIEKKLELARLKMGYTELLAPFTGAVSQVLVDESENIAAGQPAVVLTSETSPEVQVAIPEVLISRIAEGDAATVHFDALPGKTFEGTVREVGVAATRFANTYPVTLSIASNGSLIKPGMAASVTFVFGSEDSTAIYVPPHCVAEDRGLRFVYLVIPTEKGLGTVKKVKVETGELVSEGLSVTSGLMDNDRVITAGISRLEEGMTVRLLDHTPFERPAPGDAAHLN